MSLEQGQDNGQAPVQMDYYEQRIARHFHIQDRGRPGDLWLLETVHQAWRKKLRPLLESELTKRLTGSAQEEAIRVFANNLRDLLMASSRAVVVACDEKQGGRRGQICGLFLS